MSMDTYRFKVGTLDCMAINDGIHVYPTEMLFSDLPKEQLEPVLRAHKVDLQHVPSPYTCLLVTTGKNRVLIDTGGGDMIPGVGHLRSLLQKEGIQPESVDTVVLTHAHPDHIGGATDPQANPIFSKARHVLAGTEWDYWMSGRDLGKFNSSMAAGIRQKLSALQPQKELVAGETEVVPGVYVVPAPGHTPGHMAVLVASAGEQLMYLSDTVIHPLLLEKPAWRTVSDTDPIQADATRRQLCNRAASEWALVLAFHFYPTPGLGYVTRQGEGWQWQPIDTTG